MKQTLGQPLMSYKYFLNNEFKQLIKDKQNFSYIFVNSFSLLHINARSLPKNFDALEHMIDLLDMNFNVIGVTENWMYQPTSLTSLKYNFECFGTKNRAGGGVGLYILNDTEYKLRNEININCQTFMESLFIEIISKTKKTP